MTTAAELATIADLERHPGRCELIDGEIIDMAPAGFEHGRAVAAISMLLRQHVRGHNLGGEVLAGDPGFILNEKTVRAPDVAYLDAQRAKTAPQRGFMHFVPNLAVEVVSPGDHYTEVVTKARMWIGCGVNLVWVADPWSHTTDIFAPGRDVVRREATDRINGGDVLTDFSCLVNEFFA